MKRFRGTLLALAALLAVLGVARRLETRSVPDMPAGPDAVFRFEKEDLVGFRVERPDTVLEARQVDGVWAMVGKPWRPNRAMIRRVAHQLHDLDARANVVDAPQDPSVYGLGDTAIRVTLWLTDGREIAFLAGDPNPTSVSQYLMPLPGERVYVVKKSAIDYLSQDVEAFREDRVAAFDALDAVRLDAVVDGRPIAVERTGKQTWRMLEPVPQRASRDEIRAMLGRVGAMRAHAFVADAPTDLGDWRLDPPLHRIAVTLATGATHSVRVGDPVAGSDPALRYVYLEEDDAVYAVKDGFLESFRLPADQMRDRILLGKHEWDVAHVSVERGGEVIALTRTADDWRWADGRVVPGSTPKRVAARAAELRALVFHDLTPADTGFESPVATVRLGFQGGGAARLVLGRRWEAGDGGRQFVQIEGDPVVYEVDDGLASVIDDLVREHARKRQRDAARGLDGAGAGD